MVDGDNDGTIGNVNNDEKMVIGSEFAMVHGEWWIMVDNDG